MTEDRPVSLALIAAERLRQQIIEGYTSVHDDAHAHNELVITAAALAVDGTLTSLDPEHAQDPWGLVSKHRGDRIRQLVIAGALIAAEIDRVLRFQARGSWGRFPKSPQNGGTMSEQETRRQEERKVDPVPCDWRQDDEGNWDTECGETFILNEGGPEQNKMHFCCYCGARLRERGPSDAGKGK